MRQRGFTLLEVMIALALLGLGMVVLIKSAAGNIFSTEDAHMMGIATDLARGKMYDIEEILLKDGFSDSDQSDESEKCFEDEGWPNICYSYKVIIPELPSFDQLQAMAQKQAENAAKAAAGSAMGSGSALGSGEVPAGFENSAIGGMLSMLGGGMKSGESMDVTAAAGGSLIQSQYSLFQEVLKVSVRKIVLTVKWKVLGRDREMKVVYFMTDPVAMNKTAFGSLTGGTSAPQNPTTPTSPTTPTTPKTPSPRTP